MIVLLDLLVFPLSGFARELILIVVNSGKSCGNSHAAVAMFTNPRFQLLLEPS